MGVAMLTVGCAPNRGDAPTGSVSQAISGANDDDSPTANVVVKLSSGTREFCTGTLLTPRIVLTANHCINGDDSGMKPAASFPVTVAIGNTADRGSYSVTDRSSAVTAVDHRHIIGSTGEDLALLFLDAGQFVIDSPNNSIQRGAQPYIVHPTLNGPGPDVSIGQAGWSTVDSATTRQVGFDARSQTDHDDDDPGDGFNSWEHIQGSLHVNAGDSGGPIFIVRTDTRGNVYRDVFGVLSGTRKSPIGHDYDLYADITDLASGGDQWLLSQVVDTTRSTKWKATHPGYSWFGDVEYPGACDPKIDRDCDHWTDAHDNCPEIFNPDQNDSADNGIGDACVVTINSVSPLYGTVYSTVTITGTGFVDGKTSFQWVNNVKCTSSTSCRGVISGAPLFTTPVHLSAAVQSGNTLIYSKATNNDVFTIDGSGGTGCTGFWTCSGANAQTTDANFTCPTEPLGVHYQLMRRVASASGASFIDVTTKVTHTGGALSSGPTALDELGYIPDATESSLTYAVCVVSDSDANKRACSGWTLTLTGTTNHCQCQPSTCDGLVSCQSTADDGCGGTLSCGGCSDGSSCVNSHCQGNPDPGPICTPAMAKRHLCS